MSEEKLFTLHAGGQQLTYPLALWARDCSWLLTGLRDATLAAVVGDMRNGKDALSAARHEQDRRERLRNQMTRVLGR